MSQSYDITQTSDNNLPAEKLTLEEDVNPLLKASKEEVEIGKFHQAMLPTSQLSRKQIEFKKSNLLNQKLWNHKNNNDMKQTDELYKLFRRKIGRNAQHREEFFTLISRAEQDLGLVQQLIQFEDKFLKNYLQMRCSEIKNELH